MNRCIPNRIQAGALLIIIALCVTMSGCSLSPSAGDGKRAIEDRISKDSAGRIKLNDFRKTDAQQGEVMGIKFYGLEFEAEIEFLENCKWVTGLMGQQITFRTVKPNSSASPTVQLMEAAENPGMQVSKGDRMHLVGVVRFVKKESGWAVEQVNVTTGTAVAGSGNSSAPQTGQAPERQTSEQSNNVGPTSRVTSIATNREAADPVARFNLQMDELNAWMQVEAEKVQDESAALVYVEAMFKKANNLDTQGLPADFKAAWATFLTSQSELITAAKTTQAARAESRAGETNGVNELEQKELSLREKSLPAVKEYETLIKKYGIHQIGVNKPQQPATSGPAKDRLMATVAQTQIATFKTALDAYEVDNGYYPKGKNGLLDLIRQPTDVKTWRGPYLMGDGLPKDPWGNDYIYECPGQHNSSSYDLMSMGPDGHVGGGDDITNWK